MRERSQLLKSFIITALFGSLLVAAASSWLSFRLIVGRPLHALLSAIGAAESTGLPTKILEHPDDELGKVIVAFNQMQERLVLEAARKARALRRLAHIYNETPALMFSVDGDGTILNASDHWLEETGFDREEIVGLKLATLLHSSEKQSLVEVEKALAEEAGHLRNIPFSLTCKYSTRMDR